MVRTLVAVGAGRPARPDGLSHGGRRRAAGEPDRADRAAPHAASRRAGPGQLPERSRASAGCWRTGWWMRSSSPRRPRCFPSSPSCGAGCPACRSCAYGPFRPDDGELLLACRKHAVPVAVEGVDDAVVGEMVARTSVTAERRRALADAPRIAPAHRAAAALGLEPPARRGRAAGPHHRAGPASRGEPRAPLPPVRRRRRAQSQASDRPHPDRLRGPAAGQPRLLRSRRSSGCSTSPRRAT